MVTDSMFLPPSILRPRLLAGVSSLLLPLLAISGCVSAGEVIRIESSTLLRQGDAYFQQNAQDDALISYLLAIKTAAEEGDESIEAAALCQVALIYALQSDGARAGKSLTRAAALAQSSDPVVWSRFLLARGAFETAGGHPETALQTYEELYEYGSSHDLFDRASQAAHMATLLTTGSDRVGWAKRGVDSAKASGRSSWSASAWLALAWIFEDLAQHDQALDAFAKARSFAERTSSDDAVLQADWALAHGFRMAGQRRRARELAQRTLARATTAYQFSASETTTGYPEYAIWVAQCQRELAELAVEDEDLHSALERFFEARRYFVLAGLEVRAPASLALLDRRIAAVRDQMAETPVDAVQLTD